MMFSTQNSKNNVIDTDGNKYERKEESGAFLKKFHDLEKNPLDKPPSQQQHKNYKGQEQLLSEGSQKLIPTQTVIRGSQKRATLSEKQKENIVVDLNRQDSNSMRANIERKTSREQSKTIPFGKQQMRLADMKKKLTPKQSQAKRQNKDGVAKICSQKFSMWFDKNFARCWRRFKNNFTHNKKGLDSKTTKTSGTEFGSPGRSFKGKDIKSDELGDTVQGNSINNSKNNSFISNGNIIKQKLSQVAHLKTPEQSQTQKDTIILNEIIKKMDKEKLMEKAYRHLLDALLYRNVRHDLDGEGKTKDFVRVIWKIQNSNLWNDFLLFLGWVYILISFFEPSNRNDSSLPEFEFRVLIGIEIFILILQTLDLTMELIQRSTQDNSSILKVIFIRKKNFFRSLFFFLNTADLIIYASSYPTNTFRFARAIRPLQIIIFSKSLRRNFQGIINSVKHLLMILVLDIIITFFFAYIGVNMLGDIYNDTTMDTFAVDFRSFMKAANAMYIFSSLDFYPDILFPSIQSSYYYLMYFLPYLLLFLFLFAPIPTAVVYDGYRKHRLNLLIADRVKRRKALWVCYQCIVSDNKKQYIPKDDFLNFFKYVYGKVELEDLAEIIAEILWSELDANDNKKVSVEEFFKLIDITEQNSDLRLQRIKPIKAWVKFREKIEENFHLEAFLSGKAFEYLSFLITIGSCVTTVINLFSDSTSDVQDGFDKSFFAFFCTEIILKMVAFGPDGFFKESWNVFDLSLVLFQVFFDYVFYTIMSGSNVKSVSASRVLKIAKLQKVFRVFRALRTVKILSFIFSGLDIIHKVYEMLYKIAICIPIVMKLSTICVIFFYIYAVIGVELFSSNLQSMNPSWFGQNMCTPNTNSDDYTYCEQFIYFIDLLDFKFTIRYAQFDTFGGAILILLQVCVGSGWSYIQFNYGKKFDDMTASSLFFNSFHFLSVFVLSLIGGLIWEVFDVVEKIMRDKQAFDLQLEMQREWEEQQQRLEGSFQSGIDNSKKGSAKNRRSSMFTAAMMMMKMPLKQQKISMKLMKQEDDDDDFDDEEADEKQNQNGNGEEGIKNKNVFASKFLKISKESIKNGEGTKDKLDLDQSSSEIEDSETSESEDDEDDDNSPNQNDNFEKDESSQSYSQDYVNYNTRIESAEKKTCAETLQTNQMIVAESLTGRQEYEKDKKNEMEGVIKLRGSKQIQPFLSEDRTIEKPISIIEGNVKNAISSEQRLESLGDQGNASKTSFFPQLFKVQQTENGNDAQEISDFRLQQKQGSEEISEKKTRQQEQKAQKVSKKKKKKNDDMNEEIFQENDMISQRDKGQLILFQDVFKMSTLDQFFKYREIPAEGENNQENKHNQFEAIQEEVEEENEYKGKSPQKSANNSKFLPITFDQNGKGKRSFQSSQIEMSKHKLITSNQNSTSIKSAPMPLFQKIKIQNQACIDKNENEFNSFNSVLQEELEENQKVMINHFNDNTNTKKEDQFEQFHEDRRLSLNSKKQNNDSSTRNRNAVSLERRIQCTDQTMILQESERKENNLSKEQNLINLHEILQKESNQLSSREFKSDRIKSQQQLQISGKQTKNHQTTKIKLSELPIDGCTTSEVPQDDDNLFNMRESKNSQASMLNLSQDNQVKDSKNFKKDGSASELTFPISEYFPSKLLKDSSTKQNGVQNQEIELIMIEESLVEISPILKNQKEKKSQMPSIFQKKNENQKGKEEKEEEEEQEEEESKEPEVNRQCLFSDTPEQENKNVNLFENCQKGLTQQVSDWSSFAHSDLPILGQKSSRIESNFSIHKEKVEEKKTNQRLSFRKEKQIKKQEANQLKKEIEQIDLHKIKQESNFKNKGKISYNTLFLEDKMNYHRTKNETGLREDFIGFGSNNLVAPSTSYNAITNSDCVVGSDRDEEHNIALKKPSLILMKGVDNQLHTLKNSQIKQVIGNDEVPQTEESSFFKDIKDIEKNMTTETSPISPIKKKKQERKLKKRKLRVAHTAEMEKIFKQNLLDVELQGASLNNQAANPLLAQIAFSKQKSENQSLQRELIVDLPKNKLLKQYVLNVNQNLKQEQSVPIRIDLSNMNYIINSAILKQVNQEKINKIELRHFKHLYGSQFEDVLEEDISYLWNQQCRLLFHFDNLFKQHFLLSQVLQLLLIIQRFDHIQIESFIQIYCSLEMQISSLIMNKFSSVKIIFQDQEDSWFTINYVAESYFLQEIPKEGPWTFYDQMFEGRDPKRLLKHRNIYSFQDKSEYAKSYLKKAFKNSQDISNNSCFRRLQINQKRSDLIYIPFSNDRIEETRKKTLDILTFQSSNLPEYIRKVDLKIDQIPQIKKGLVIAHLFDNPISKERKTQFQEDKLNLNKALIEDDVLQKDLINSTLNYTYSIEFLKDIRNHLNMSKDQLFTKISQFYFYRYCFEKNFQDIQEVPFE